MLSLKIPSVDGGEEEGLNDGNIETFLSRPDYYIARECAQNAIDAAVRDGSSDPAMVMLEMDRYALPAKDIPNVENMRDVMHRCREFWLGNPKFVAFFDRAAALLALPEVPMLHISDSGTTGLTGADMDRKGKWYGLIRSSGVSNKDDIEGGSYGIGKFAPFAGSALRTVFYSTRTCSEGSPFSGGFQGVLRLASHGTPDGRIARRTGYIGVCGNGEACGAARGEEDIPVPFRRSKRGTSIHVAGYTGDKDWSAQMVRSVIENFWPAIHKKIINFRIAGIRIDHSNLGNLLLQHASLKDFDAHLYYRAMVAGQYFEKNLPMLGKVSLHLHAAPDELPKRVAMTRQTGMIIECKRFQSRKPFCGYLVCETKEGNLLLRSMEPPRHDKWDENRGTPEARKALAGMHDWIRECIKTLNPVPKGQALDVPDLERYLPDLEGDNEAESPVPAGAGSPDRQFASHIPPAEVPIVEMPPQPPKPQAVVTTGGGDELETGSGGESEGENEGNRSGTKRQIHGQGGGNNRARDHKGRIAMRSFVRNDGLYQLVVAAQDGDVSGVRVFAVGDDNTTEGLEIASALDADTQEQIPVKGSSLSVAIKSGEKRRLLLGVKSSIRLALSAEAK